MAIKISVGLGKKLGLPNYGSLSANCQLEFEGEAAWLQDVEMFHRQVRNAYAACRRAVDEELARQQEAGVAPGAVANGAKNGQGVAEPPQETGGSAGRNGTGGQGNGRGATEKQLGFARQLSKAIQGLGVRRLESLAQKMYGRPLAALTSLDASGLIDTLKAIKDGQISLEAALEGTAP